MTPEEIRDHILWEIMDRNSLREAWEAVPQIEKNAIGIPIVEAVIGAVEAERLHCMADVCEGCREVWDRIDRGAETAFHRDPDGEIFLCNAHRIIGRASMEKGG